MKNKSVIPHGMYCYTRMGYKNGVYKIKPCPYWDKVEGKPKQGDGYCHYLETGDWEEGNLSLLWDQVKECGINEGGQE